MRNYIIFLCLSCLLSPISLSGQGNSLLTGNVAYAEKLYQDANYKAAVKEFLRVHYYDRTGDLERTTKEIAYCFSELNDSDNALKYLQKYLRIEDLNLDEKAEASYKKVEIYLKYNYPLALVELFQFDDKLIDLDSDRYHYYLASTQFLGDNFSEGFDALGLLSYYDELPYNQLVDIKERLEKNDKKNHFVPRMLSTILPGLGQAVNGEAKDGFNSLIINGALMVLFFHVQANLSTTDAIISVIPWFGRFYVGGMQNAVSASYKKQSRIKKEMLYKLNGLIREAKEKA